MMSGEDRILDVLQILGTDTISIWSTASSPKYCIQPFAVQQFGLVMGRLECASMLKTRAGTYLLYWRKAVLAVAGLLVALLLLRTLFRSFTSLL